MYNLIPMRRTVVLFILVCCFFILISHVVRAEVYVNMLWDPVKEEFDIKPLVLEGYGITFDRDYQNAYGELLNLEPGPPFYVQSSILASNTYNDDGTIDGFGTITFESGGIGLLDQPFEIFVSNAGVGGEGRISADGGVSFIGTSLDPIKIQGPWMIESGYNGGSDPFNNGQHSSIFQNTNFNCNFNQDVWNLFPIQFHGSNITIENCFFSGFSEEFGNFISMNDLYTGLSEPVWNVVIRNNRFEGLNYSDTWIPFNIENFNNVIIEDNVFKNYLTLEDNDDAALIRVNDCGIKSIKNNSGSGNNWNFIQLVGTWTTGEAEIKSDNNFSIKSTSIHIPENSSLHIKSGTVLKFSESSGGFYVEGSLVIDDSTVLTSCLDDAHGASTCYPPQSAPIINNWYADGGAGIVIDTTASAYINGTKILYARGGMRVFGELDMENSEITDCSDFGILFQGDVTYEYTLKNTDIKRTDGSGPYAAGIFYENRSSYPQILRLDSCQFILNDMNAVEISYVSGAPTIILMDGCKLISNYGYGMVFPIDPMLSELEVTNSLVLGNATGGLVGRDYYGTANPMRFENNVCIGNGHGAVSSYRHGISISAGTPQFVGNTLAYNYYFGIGMYQIDTIEHCQVANNLFVRNGDYGFISTDYGDPLFANNNFWQNENGDELRYRGPSGYIYSVEEIQALGGEFATNMHLDPVQVPEVYGTIDSIEYDDIYKVSKLIDASLSGSTLTHKAICPDTSDVDWYYILYQISDTLWIAGDITGKASIGDTYRVYDYHLTDASPMIDVGRNTSVTLLYDVEGDERYIDGDNNGFTYVDIGADEYNPDAGIEAPIRVNKPDSSSLFVSYDSATIKFQVADSISQVNIAYTISFDEANPDNNWDTIATNVDASSGEYKWKVPDNITTSECYIKVISSHTTTLSAMSEPFAMKQLILTRSPDPPELFIYSHPDNSWSFTNDSVTMWPQEVWPNYMNDIDTITGFQYPLEFADIHSQNSDFPSWPRFVEAFGVDACYMNTWAGHIYRPSAVLRWGAIKRSWRGSCFGLALTNMMAFVDSASFASRQEVGPFSNLNSLLINNDLRRLINRYYTYQFGQEVIAHTAEVRELSVNHTLDQLKEMLKKRVVSNSDFFLTMCDTSTVNNLGCHSVTPYYLVLLDSVNLIWHLMVYDNNRPGEYTEIVIDEDDSSWTYTPLGFAGKNSLFLENPLLDFEDYPELTAEPKDLLPIASGAGRIELYVSSADSIRLTSSGGSIGCYTDSLFNELTESSPIIPRGSKGEPIGYFLRDGEWSCSVTGAADNFVGLTEIGDNFTVSYKRSGVLTGETDIVHFNDAAMTVMNPDGTNRSPLLDFVIPESSNEKAFQVRDYMIAPGDSSTMQLTDDAGLRIAHYGSQSYYTITVRHIDDTGLFVFSTDSVEIAAISEQYLEPDWSHINNDSLRILIDFGIDGEIDDTVYVQNDIVTSVGDEGEYNLPDRFGLMQNYPNPFNPSTTISFSIPERSDVTLSIFNIMGQKIEELVNGELKAGVHTVSWDGSDFSSGVYLYRLQTDDYTAAKKMLLIK